MGTERLSTTFPLPTLICEKREAGKLGDKSKKKQKTKYLIFNQFAQI